jgi:UDP-arabinose 4-epimerase
MREAVGTSCSLDLRAHGVPEKLPISETTAKPPLNLMATPSWRSSGRSTGAPRLRYVLYGAALLCRRGRPDGEIGENHEPETHLIPLVPQRRARRGQTVDYCTDYPTPTAARSAIHPCHRSGDAHLRALGHLAAGGDSAALNLGTGSGSSVREVIAAVERVGGRKVPHREVVRRPGDPPELVADPALARAQLGWQPRHSDLDTIIGTALAWETRPGRAGQPADK